MDTGRNRLLCMRGYMDKRLFVCTHFIAEEVHTYFFKYGGLRVDRGDVFFQCVSNPWLESQRRFQEPPYIHRRTGRIWARSTLPSPWRSLCGSRCLWSRIRPQYLIGSNVSSEFRGHFPKHLYSPWFACFRGNGSTFSQDSPCTYRRHRASASGRLCERSVTATKSLVRMRWPSCACRDDLETIREGRRRCFLFFILTCRINIRNI